MSQLEVEAYTAMLTGDPVPVALEIETCIGLFGLLSWRLTAGTAEGEV